MCHKVKLLNHYGRVRGMFQSANSFVNWSKTKSAFTDDGSNQSTMRMKKPTVKTTSEFEMTWRSWWEELREITNEKYVPRRKKTQKDFGNTSVTIWKRKLEFSTSRVCDWRNLAKNWRLDKAEILQKQFCRVFTKEPDGELPAFPPRTDREVEMNLNVYIVKKEILVININKAVGPDEIHPRMLKELVDYITIPLFIIMKKSLMTGNLPDDWKLADVSPIFKKGAKNLAENYRPISLTSISCRILEKFMKNKIMNHLIQEKPLSSKQHGFVNGRSTVTQLLNYLDRATEVIAEGKVVDVIYFDFAGRLTLFPIKDFYIN